MTDRRVSGPDRRKQALRGMRSQWNLAFAILLALSTVTAALSIAVVQRVESTFASAANEVIRETVTYDVVLAAVNEETAAGHLVLDQGSVVAGAFSATDGAARAAFDAAAATYNSDAERALIVEARAQWDTTFETVRALAADPVAADVFAADTSPAGDMAHGVLGIAADATSGILHRLDLVSRGALEDRLDEAHADKSRLLALLGAIFLISVGATIVYARRMARRVVRPIGVLRVSADRFGSGELDHRVELHSGDEIGELAERFNVMADTIASAHRHLTVQAHHDALTGLVNRAGFVGCLDAAVKPDQANAGGVSLMFIDLDDFKHVNDKLGHAAGDELLRQVSERLLGATTATDVVCRLGGDEFAVLVANPGHEEGTAVDTADRVLAALEQPFSIHGALIRVGASIGIASQSSPADSGDYLLRAADVAMYAAKGQGKHRWQVFDAKVHGPVTTDVSSILARLDADELDGTRL